MCEHHCLHLSPSKNLRLALICTDLLQSWASSFGQKLIKSANLQWEEKRDARTSKGYRCSLQQLSSNLPETETMQNWGKGSPISILLERENALDKNSSFTKLIRKLSKSSPLQTVISEKYLAYAFPPEFLRDFRRQCKEIFCVEKVSNRALRTDSSPCQKGVVSLILGLIVSEKEQKHWWR